MRAAALSRRCSARGVNAYPAAPEIRTGRSQPCLTMRDTAVRTAGGVMPSGAMSMTSEAIGADPPRDRRWSPYKSKSADLAFMTVISCLVGPTGCGTHPGSDSHPKAGSGIIGAIVTRAGPSPDVLGAVCAFEEEGVRGWRP